MARSKPFVVGEEKPVTLPAHQTVDVPEGDPKMTRAWAGMTATDPEPPGTRLGFSPPVSRATPPCHEPAASVSETAPPPPALPEVAACVSAPGYGEPPPVSERAASPRWLLVFAVVSGIVGLCGLGLALVSLVRQQLASTNRPIERPPVVRAALKRVEEAAPVKRVEEAAPVKRVEERRPVPVATGRPVVKPAARTHRAPPGFGCVRRSGRPSTLAAAPRRRSGAARPARPGDRRRGVRVRYDRKRNVVDVFLPSGDEPRINVVRSRKPVR